MVSTLTLFPAKAGETAGAALTPETINPVPDHLVTTVGTRTRGAAGAVVGCLRAGPGVPGGSTPTLARPPLPSDLAPTPTPRHLPRPAPLAGRGLLPVGGSAASA